MIAKKLEISSASFDCNGAVRYRMTQKKLEAKVVCNTVVDTLLADLHLFEEEKRLIRQAFKHQKKDTTTTVVADICKCTCSNINDYEGKR
jgi:hypothetical protein